MEVFAAKLSRLPETIAAVGDHGAADLAQALVGSGDRIVAAIGSGGSAVAAEYFARCRTTLGLGPTFVMTPMEFVLSMGEWAGAEVWLFSAGANNADVAAAFRAAATSRCEAIRLVTVRLDGATAIAAAVHPRAEVFVLPVADPKDGFLATHSMVAMVAGLLFGSDLATERPQGRDLVDAFGARATAALSDGLDELVGGFRRGDTVVAVHDPQLAAVAVLLETSLWETGIAPIQRTDFRNFAHGRHVWAARHPGAMFVLSLTTDESEVVWRPIDAAIPAEIRRGGMLLGHGGRLCNAVGIVRALAAIGHLGDVAGIDPGKPGRGPFAEAIYDDASLLTLADGLTAAVRHKAAARQLHDPADEVGGALCALGAERLRDLAEAKFTGIVLDYDGTVVHNQPLEARLGPPSKVVMDELVRLVDCGVRVGFATGRGGSAGKKLREALPSRVHDRILMGYYNGAHVRPLDIDITDDRPAVNEGVASVADWIAHSGMLRDGVHLDAREVQVTVNHTDLIDVATFAARLAECPEVVVGDVRVLRSHHSFDVVPRGTTKLTVVRAIAGNGGFVLGVGDSGSPLGNDHELLSGPYGVSLDSVCGSHIGAWTLFGSRLRGPDALARLLGAARAGGGAMTIDLSDLDLDRTE
ncbi:hypothetical protein [Novosphingobium sp. FKTRR1]|uniref:hypothetical protein n=1 Tax=Novosphingobium sp. FKTRR1 TaxID=2879118 RepID=UPI001CF06D8E|nr:hypothetical protein [Novosphingobium sp. FKTRR1]